MSKELPRLELAKMRLVLTEKAKEELATLSADIEKLEKDMKALGKSSEVDLQVFNTLEPFTERISKIIDGLSLGFFEAEIDYELVITNASECTSPRIVCI